MKSKDQQLLEEAYQSIVEAMRSDSRQEKLDGLVKGFHMNPNKEEALDQIKTAYQGKVVTLYKHGHGDVKAGPDQYSSEYELTQNDEVTGKVEDISSSEDENGHHLIFRVAGKDFDLTQSRYWVKLADLGDGSASKARSVSKWTGGSALRPPGMR
jgi:hypothetical protein